MPISSGRPEAGWPPSATTRRFSASNRVRSASSPGSRSASPESMIVTRRSICRTMTSMCLSWIVHALAAVDLLHLVDQVLLHGPRAEDAQHLLRVDRAGDELLADLDVLAVLDQQARALGDGVGELLGAVVRGHDDLRPRSVSSIVTRPATSAIGATPLGVRASNSSWTRGRPWVMSSPRHTTGVEGAHRQLGAGLADRLGGDDADRLADVDELAGGQRAAVAPGAGADLGLAGQDRADLDLLDAGGDQRVDEHVADVGAGLGQDGAVVLDAPPPGCASTRWSRRRRAGAASVGGLHRDRQGQAALGAAVLLADDDVLRRRRPDDG